MFHLLITLDYELPASGMGDVRRYIIRPSEMLLSVCEQYGAKLTIMAEMAELWAFEDPQNTGFSEYLGYSAAPTIRDQLRDIVRRGHDVQLHLHPQWLLARWQNLQWQLDYSHYMLTDFGDAEIISTLRRGREDLQAMLRPVAADYRCVAFRAGNWNTTPPSRYLAALRESGLESDTSVFKWGYSDTCSACFDYRQAWSNLLPWFACEDDINRPSSDSSILEIPIATERVRSFKLLTPRRIRRGLRYVIEDCQTAAGVRHSLGQTSSGGPVSATLRKLFGPCSRKLDFCKLTGRQILATMTRLMKQYESLSANVPVPIVMIGHSKECDTARDLDFVLRELSQRYADRLAFTSYRTFLSDYRNRIDRRDTLIAAGLDI